MKKLQALIIGAIISLSLTGCKSIQIWETPPATEAQYTETDKMDLNVYYVKKGTKFSPVYMPNCSFSGVARYVDSSRVIYMYDDQPMIPEHYKNEIIAYSSTKADLQTVTLERFKDMGYSLGIYGGKIEADGYYHMSSTKNVCPDSDAEKVFSKVASTEIRIVSIGGVPISKVVDETSGVITSLQQDQSYMMELYAGTFFYRLYFKADTQFLKAMELYTYNSDKIFDTPNGYRSFETPNTLKSGYYMVNGAGLFLYHSYTKEEYVENESLNESGFETVAESLASYSQEFRVSVPYDTKDVIITAHVNNIDANSTGKIIAPNGTVYDMTVNVPDRTLKLELSVAKAGEWMVYIPQYLEASKVDVEGSEVAEETICEEYELVYDKEARYQRFTMNLYGTGKVYAYMKREGDQRIFDFFETEKRTSSGGQRYIYLDMPYMDAGTYTVYVYYYQSTTELGELNSIEYENSDSDIIIIDN